MNKIHNFDYWLSENKKMELTSDQVEFLNNYTNGKWIYDESSGLVNIEGSFSCIGEGLKNLKGVNFGEVSEDFYCSENNLTSLVGSPIKVGGDFTCNYNKIESLEGSPDFIGGYFGCRHNRLSTLKGGPKIVKGMSYQCDSNKLVSLEGAPDEIDGDFGCQNNSLKNLNGSPKKVGGGFYCSDNPINSLKGSPRIIGGDFFCTENELESMEGAPEKIGGEVMIAGTERSPVIYMDGSEWTIQERNLQVWMRLLRTGTDEQKALVSTLPAIKEIQDGHPEDFEDLSDLADLGF